jgi:hypothetical protein
MHTNKLVGIGLLVGAAAVIAIAGLTPVDTTSGDVGPAGSGLPIDTDSSTTTRTPSPADRHRPTITLGDLDAPSTASQSVRTLGNLNPPQALTPAPPRPQDPAQHARTGRKSMHHIRLGDDPQWAAYRVRERLEFTDPSTATPGRYPPMAARRDVAAVIAALAITTTLQADTAPSNRADTAKSPTHRHLSLSHHTKEILP